MPLREDILNPISESAPGGQDLRYDPIYDKIKEARREEDDAPQGEWAHERKVADYRQVIKLASETIATRSKDLQLAAWLTEALIHQEGYPGLREGIDLIRGIVDGFWDSLYPEIEDGDLELRAAPIEWVGSRLGAALAAVPMTPGGYSFAQYKDSRAVPSEESAAKDDKQAEIRALKIADGRVTPEEFENSFQKIPKARFVETAEQLDGCLESLDSLAEVCGAKFGADAPSLSGLKQDLEEIRHQIRIFLQRKRELEPDEAPGEAGAAAAETGPEGGAEAGPAAVPAAGAVGGYGRRLSAEAPEAAFEAAKAAARSGNFQEAMRILSTELALEPCARARFIRKTQIAQLCVDSGREEMARPILEELATEIEKRGLENWEMPDVISRPLALLYRCLVKLDGDYAERQALYARVCRLNPLEALSCPH